MSSQRLDRTCNIHVPHTTTLTFNCSCTSTRIGIEGIEFNLTFINDRSIDRSTINFGSHLQNFYTSSLFLPHKFNKRAIHSFVHTSHCKTIQHSTGLIIKKLDRIHSYKSCKVRVLLDYINERTNEQTDEQRINKVKKGASHSLLIPFHCLHCSNQ